MSTSNQKLAKVLTKSGLSEKEAAVYLAALHLGPTTISQIAQKSGLKRSTVYDIISKLSARGLMTETYTGLKKRFSAESPRVLQNLIEEQKQNLQSHLPQLMNLHSFPAAEHSVKIYEGVEGLKNSLNLMISDLKPGDDYFVIANIEDILEITGKFFYDFAKRRAKHNITLKTMLQDGPLTREYIQWAKRTREEIKVLPADQNFMANIVVTPHRVVMPHIKPFTGAIVIENSQAIDTHQKLFRMLWDMHYSD